MGEQDVSTRGSLTKTPGSNVLLPHRFIKAAVLLVIFMIHALAPQPIGTLQMGAAVSSLSPVTTLTLFNE